MKTHTELVEELARLQYDNYCAAVGGKAFNGDALPSSEEFFSDESKKKQANAWRSAAASGVTWAEYTYDLEIQDFAWAIKQIKSGEKVRRKGWNAKGMWVAMSGVILQGCLVASEHLWSPHAKRAAEELGGSIMVQPAIIMFTAAKEIQMGWLASQADMLAQDWEIAE